MRDFKHWPLTIAVAAIIATQVLCTRWLVDSMWASQSDYSTALDHIDSNTDKTAYNTNRIDLNTKGIENEITREDERRARQDVIDKLGR